MCIVTDEVRHIANTRIFVAPLGDKRQLTIYSNEVQLMGDSDDDDTMSPYVAPLGILGRLTTPIFRDKLATTFPGCSTIEGTKVPEKNQSL